MTLLTWCTPIPRGSCPSGTRTPLPHGVHTPSRPGRAPVILLPPPPRRALRRHLSRPGAEGDAASAADHHSSWAGAGRFPGGPCSVRVVCFIGRLAEVKGPATAIDVARAAGLPIGVAGAVHPPDRGYADLELSTGWPSPT